MTDLLRIAHPQNCPPYGNSRVGICEIHLLDNHHHHINYHHHQSPHPDPQGEPPLTPSAQRARRSSVFGDNSYFHEIFSWFMIIMINIIVIKERSSSVLWEILIIMNVMVINVQGWKEKVWTKLKLFRFNRTKKISDQSFGGCGPRPASESADYINFPENQPGWSSSLSFS